MSAKREMIEPGDGDRRHVRRDELGQFADKVILAPALSDR